MEQAAQRACRVSVLGYTQKSARESAELPSVTSALSGDWAR